MDSKTRMSRLSLDLLKGFEAAARHLSFTRAAQELFLTQSAVSREIKTLEDQLGQPLFHRVNRGLRLTDAGETLYRAVSEALLLIEQATGRLASTRTTETLTVTTSVPLASMWLVPKLQRFFQLYPDVDVRSLASNETLDLERERLDLAIRWIAPGAVAAGADHLFDVEIFPVCSPRRASEIARPLKIPSDLARHVILDFDTVTGRGPWSDWQQWLAGMKLDGLRPAGTLRFSHFDQVTQAAINGSGVAMGRSPHNTIHLREGLLVAPFGPQARLSFGCYVAMIAKRSADRPVVGKFLSWLRDEVCADRGVRSDAGQA
jgi:LysR family transcriptional regulator, glycine cleavage system transcriptional activator